MRLNSLFVVGVWGCDGLISGTDWFWWPLETEWTGLSGTELDKLDEASLSSVHFYQMYTLLIFNNLSCTNACGWGVQYNTTSTLLWCSLFCRCKNADYCVTTWLVLLIMVALCLSSGWRKVGHRTPATALTESTDLCAPFSSTSVR